MADTRKEEDWVALPWSRAKKGQQVWIKGTERTVEHIDEPGHFRAYGPHHVFDPEHRRLVSGSARWSGRHFYHYGNDLIVPKEGQDESE